MPHHPPLLHFSSLSDPGHHPEIERARDADAVATVRERGVRVVASAHGRSLRDLASNAPLRSLLGGGEEVAGAIPTTRRIFDSYSARFLQRPLSDREMTRARCRPPPPG